MLGFLLDENIDIRLAKYLIAKNFSIEFPSKGASDQEVFQQAVSSSLILVTLDKDFANRDLYKPSENSGIIILRVHPPVLENLINVFNNTLAAISPNEFVGKIITATPNGLEITSNT